ncbi:MAG: threonine/serine exporter family protein [Peptoniphilaceae bacterium]|nr:threonine/serine exporter family protein [Peptoniphilaceae bacterium]MDY6019265.1 threonine/serine exporter family protein [Anaerococcus sp.]
MDQLKINNDMDAMLLLEIASNAGELLLENGAEVYRAEETVERIVSYVGNVKDVDVYSTFNGIMISYQVGSNIKSSIRKIKTRKYNLSKINKLNNFSRNFCKGQYSFEQALEILDKINKEQSIPKSHEIMGVAIATAAFTAVINKNLLEIFVAFFVGLMAVIITTKTEKKQLGFFVNNFFTGNLISLFTLGFKYFLPNIIIDNIIIGAMMPFLAGALLTTGVRDLMSGNVTSGLTAALTAILTTIALALGVALPMQLMALVGA